MKLVGRNRLKVFTNKHPDATPWVEHWLAEVRQAKWEKPQDIKARYRTASFLPDNIVIFNVKGNSYRMEVQIAYKAGAVTVKRLGTHSEYNQWYR